MATLRFSYTFLHWVSVSFYCHILHEIIEIRSCQHNQNSVRLGSLLIYLLLKLTQTISLTTHSRRSVTRLTDLHHRLVSSAKSMETRVQGSVIYLTRQCYVELGLFRASSLFFFFGAMPSAHVPVSSSITWCVQVLRSPKEAFAAAMQS